MGESNFVGEFTELIQTVCTALDGQQELTTIYTHSGQPSLPGPTIQMVPFVTGRRPVDEATYPGLGSSDNACMILGEGIDSDNRAYILFQLDGLELELHEKAEALALDATLAFTGSDGSLPPIPISGWHQRSVPFQVLAQDTDGQVVLHTVAPYQIEGKRLVLELFPERDLLAARPKHLTRRETQTGPATGETEDSFTFENLFSQQLQVTLRLTRRGILLATAQTWLDVCDTRRFGSLYQRIVAQVISPDTEHQATAAGMSKLDPAFHPWFPVLLIGSDKAALYTQALVEDIVHKKRHLTDPRWLMRIGIYLEFLTCIGIFEAVKDELGDLLTPAERYAYENSPLFAPIREHLNPEGWHGVWKLHQIILPRVPKTGPVSILNLLQKKKATLAFLEVHHQDLKRAIELAGVNKHNSQETWYRVFRDAERAVLRKTADAFPELSFLPQRVRQLLLWHRQGSFKLPFFKNFSLQVSKMPGDQDGLFASACNQYRLSMNEVAEWARQRNLMDYTGSECVPAGVSLLQAFMNNDHAHFEQLQRRDGYAGDSLKLNAELPSIALPSTEQIYILLSQLELFKTLTRPELDWLANSVRRIQLGPLERILIEGRSGSSLFIVGGGTLEVLARQPNGVDLSLKVVGKGELLGEIALLTGAPRRVTVRAISEAVVYEIGQQQYKPLLKTHPELIDRLLHQMELNLSTRP